MIDNAPVENGPTISQYEGVATRLLEEHERPYPTAENNTPLVIQPELSSDVSFLKEFLITHADSVQKDIYEHGAVLLRGFRINSSHAFESVLGSILGFRPMSGYFMAESGRDRVQGTKYVFETNSLFLGGDFRFGAVHSENYYSPDVPRFQSFCCLKKSWMGGETGLVHMGNAYADLSGRLSLKLEQDPFVASIFPLSAVAEHYQLDENEVERFLKDNKIPLQESGGAQFMLNYKPCIFYHPHTKTRTFQVNLSQELKGLGDEITPHFVPYYSGSRWAVHRLAWKKPQIQKALTFLFHVPTMIRHPGFFGRFLFSPIFSRLAARFGKKKKRLRFPKVTRLGERLDKEDIKLLGRAIWKHTSVFTWKMGDILIVDNLQMAHGSMPGFGPRDIKVVMGNPVPIATRSTSGLLKVEADETYCSLHDRILNLANPTATLKSE